MNNIKQNFTIKDLQNISGIKAHTIRIWEKRYALLQPQRTETNIRFYSNQNLTKLLNISLLNKNGFKISKIAEMSEEEILDQSRNLALKVATNDEAINAFKLSMFQFDKTLFNDTYSKLLNTIAFRDLFKDVFIPFLEQIGLLWQTETLLPAHEHFISNLIAQKIQINTEKSQSIVATSNNTFVLFLPENEIHELGLLYLNYELVLRGNHTIYLGQSLPLDNLNYFFESDRNITFITSLTIRPYDDDISNYFETIDVILNTSKHNLIAIGRITEKVKEVEFKSNITLYDSVKDFLKVI